MKKKGLRYALLAAGAALVVAAHADIATAQPANCGDVNNDGQITAADLSALAAGTVNAACSATSCYDINGTGGAPDLGDQVTLGRFLAGGGTMAEPGRSQGEQNLLYKLCTGAPAPLPCNSAATPMTGRFTANVTIPGPADGCNEFFIAHRVTIANNATLTVRPGALVKAIVDPSDPTLILITRGAHLNANGATNPIIFTSAATPGTRQAGDWGGIVQNGFAPENIVGDGSSEGLPPGADSAYGGNNPNAFTSQLRFVRVEFSGVVIGEANELNILTQNSLGRLSVLDHVQAHHGKDDCFEWFGGNVTGKFLLATACGDDGLDWQIGYQGQPDPATTPLPAVQFALVADDGASIASDPDAHGIEADNSEFGANLQPRSAPYFCNITAVGTTATGGPANTGDGARLRRGTAGRIQNSIFENWSSNGIDIRDSSPIDLAPRILLFNDGATPCTGSAECADVTVTGASSLLGPLDFPDHTAGYCTPAGALVDNRYFPTGAVLADASNNDACHAFDPFFDSAPYPGAFDGTTNWITSTKKCCPDNDPYHVFGDGQRCWASFDLN
jgi:hypothetical protein